MKIRPAYAVLLAPAFLSGLQVSPAQSSTSQPENLVRSGVAARQHEDFKTAIADFRQALTLRPGMVEAQIGLGEALASAGDLDEAIALDRQALAASPGNAGLQTNLGLAYYRKGDVADARRQFEAVHSAHPDDLNAAVMLGFTYNKLGRSADTVALLGPLEAGHESDLGLKYALGFAMLDTGASAEGLVRIEKVAAARNQADAWMLASSARLQLRQFKEALADAQHAVQANPLLPGVHTVAGQALYATGDWEKAAGEFQAALRQNPRDFVANQYLGLLRFGQRDLANAEPLLELALSIHPKDPLTRLTMARLRNLQGRTDEALALLEGLEKSDPDWIDPHINLAALYYKLGRPKDGQREQDIVKRLGELEDQKTPHK